MILRLQTEKNSAVLSKKLASLRTQSAPEQIYTRDLQRLADFLLGVSSEIGQIRKEMEERLAGGGGDAGAVRGRFERVEQDLRFGLDLHGKCKSIFEQENIKGFGQNKELFRFKSVPT